MQNTSKIYYPNQIGVKINVINQALILALDPFDAFPIVCSSQSFKCFQEAFIATAIMCVIMLCAIPQFPWECGGLSFGLEILES